jgi:hypothetical protein
MEPVSLNLSAYLQIILIFGTDASETFQLAYMHHPETNSIKTKSRNSKLAFVTFLEYFSSAVH